MDSKELMSICGARTKGTGNPCKRFACKNGRCKYHGGRSTGPKTEEGRRRCAEARTKHGMRSKKGLEERRMIRELLSKIDSEAIRINQKST